MTYAIIRVGDTHYGDLPPNIAILVPVTHLEKHAPTTPGEQVTFKAPGGGWAWGRLIGFTTPEMDSAMELTS